MTTGKLFANLEDRTLRCPGDFPGAGSSNAPNSATWRLGFPPSSDCRVCGGSAAAP